MADSPRFAYFLSSSLRVPVRLSLSVVIVAVAVAVTAAKLLRGR